LATLGQRIRRRRLDLGETQRTVAAGMGVRLETVAGWELDRFEPAVRLWPRVIEFLGCDPLARGEGLGDRVRAFRRQLGLTQRELAKRLGMDPGTIGDLECGRRTPRDRVAASVERFIRLQQ
jgi:transcriptional regulator with XRE-family HTH domain